MDHGFVRHDDFEACYQGLRPEDLFRKMTSAVPIYQELVSTHGDYCFDNILVDEGKLSGLIDMDRGGIADKYQDIALAVRSIEHELGKKHLDLFFYQYELERVDQEKIEFYLMLDEFF